MHELHGASDSCQINLISWNQQGNCSSNMGKHLSSIKKVIIEDTSPRVSRES